MNKNDLRYIKTEKIIKDTYLSIKLKNENKIKINDLCNKALINKSTFYSHYETIDALHEAVCSDVIENEILCHLNFDNATNDIESFIISIVKLIQEKIKLLDKLFSGNKPKLINFIEKALLSRFSNNKDFKNQEKEIIFAIGGSANLLSTNQSESMVKETIKLIKTILR